MTNEELYNLCKEKVEYHKELFYHEHGNDMKNVIDFVYFNVTEFLILNEEKFKEDKYKDIINREETSIIIFIREAIDCHRGLMLRYLKDKKIEF